MTPIDTAALRDTLANPESGGYTSFEGWVRNHNEGHKVRRLEYEAFEPLAVKEGERIVAEAIKRFGIERAACVHRVGDLGIGDMAVWVGASARHRDEAFRACRYIIDEVKHRVPIWKKEHYENGDSGWVNCERCAAPGRATKLHDHCAWRGARHARACARPRASRTHHARHSRQAPPQAAQARLNAPPASAQNTEPDYSRQIALKEVGDKGQAKLRNSQGAGHRLRRPRRPRTPVSRRRRRRHASAWSTATSSKPRTSTARRCTRSRDVGEHKAILAADRLRALNPEIDARAYTIRLTADNASELVSEYDLVIDCTDNFSTKFLLNDVCVRLRKPVIFSSVYQYEGQLQVVRPDRDGACLRCVWPEATRDGLVGNCAEAGVLGPVPGVFGSLQALEALKTLLDLPGQLGNELLVLDLLTMSTSRVRIKRAATCPDHASSRVVRALGTHGHRRRGIDRAARAEFRFARRRGSAGLQRHRHPRSPRAGGDADAVGERAGTFRWLSCCTAASRSPQPASTCSCAQAAAAASPRRKSCARAARTTCTRCEVASRASRAAPLPDRGAP